MCQVVWRSAYKKALPNSVLMEGTLFRLHSFFAPFPAFGLILC